MRRMYPLLLLIFSFFSNAACRDGSIPEGQPETLVSYPSRTTTVANSTSTPLDPSPTRSLTAEIKPTLTPTEEVENTSCSVGVGLRQETVEYLLKNLDYRGLVMTGSSLMAEEYFPQFSGWTRVIGAPSLETIKNKAERAELNNVPYEALSYGLETSETTPDAEWQDLIGSAEAFANLANRFGKISLLGPGLRLMSTNEDKYGPMAELADIWMLQTQRIQQNPPGNQYSNEVERIIHLIKSSHPQTKIWAQITFPPDAPPDVEEWLAYYESISDLVDGIYIGIYSWGNHEANDIIDAINNIYQSICKEPL